MTTIVGISGSLRSGSFNSALLRAAVELAPDGVTIDTHSLEGIPLYDGDVEAASGVPPAAASLKEQIVAADGLLLVTPEYNNSIPGVFKNAIDWLSRPVADIPRVFGARKVAVMGASPSNFGTLLSQTAWLPVLKKLGATAWSGGTMMVSGAAKAFDDHGLVDERARENLAKFLAGFVEFVGARDAPATAGEAPRRL